MANIKYADPTYPLITPTDDDQVMFRTGAGADGRAPLVQPKGYIDGLKLEWVSGTQVRITTGAAYVPGPKRIAELASAVTLTPSLSASTWYHVYLTVVGSTVSAEAVTTVPAAPYTGTARAKTGDTSRRYIGSFRTDAAGAVRNFVNAGDRVSWRVDTGSIRPLSSGTSTTWVTVSAADVAPVTATELCALCFNTGSANFRLRAPGGTWLADTEQNVGVPAGAYMIVPLALVTAQTFDYRVDAGGIGFVTPLSFCFSR